MKRNTSRAENNPNGARPTFTSLCPRLSVSIAAGLLAALAIVSKLPIATAQIPTCASQDCRPSAQGAETSLPAIRQTVRRVVVDVVVTDARDQPVLGLQAADFRIYEDGRPQTIRHFDAHSPSEAPPALLRPPNLPPHTYMNLPSAAEAGPITVVLYDLLNTPLDAQLSAHRAVVDFLKSRPKNTSTAFFVLSDRLHLLQGFTSDPAELQAAAAGKGASSQRSAGLENADGTGQVAQSIADLGGDPAASTAAQGKPMPGSNATADRANTPSSPVDMLARAEALEAAARLDSRVDATLDALDRIARFLSSVPGRKNLVWLSGSFPVNVAQDPDAAFKGNDLVRSYSARIRDIGDMLNASRVAVYPVDLRGLTVNPMYDASSRKNYAPGTGGASNIPASVKAIQDYNHQQAAEHSTMDQLGDRTGGRAFYNTNALEQAMQSAATDGSNYYSLEYSPENARYDGSLRNIKVTLHRDSVRLTYRKSYFADDIENNRPKDLDPAETSAQLGPLLSAMQFGAPPANGLIFAAHVDAIGAPTPATPEQIQSLVPYLQSASRATHKALSMPQSPVVLQRYALRYAVLASQLDLSSTRDNVYTADLTFAVLAFDQEGITLTGLQSSIQDAIPASRIEEVRRNGYRTVQTVDVPIHARSLRIAVRDGRTSRIGSLEVPLPLPPAVGASAAQ